MSRIAQVTVFVPLLFLGTAAAAEETKPLHSAEHSAAETVARGRSLYAHHCSHCHGFNMVTSGTIAYDLRKFPHNDKARFVDSVINGKGGMPPWKGTLSAEQLDLLWAYVLTGGKR